MFEVRSVPSTIDIGGMTTDQRDGEVCKLLARAVRRLYFERKCHTTAPPKFPDTPQKPLEVSARTRLSVTDG